MDAKGSRGKRYNGCKVEVKEKTVHTMLARISREKIVLQEFMTHWDVRAALEEINKILLSKGMRPQYFFEGTPVMGQGGFSVIIKLDKPLTGMDARTIARLLRSRGIRIIFEDEDLA